MAMESIVAEQLAAVEKFNKNNQAAPSTPFGDVQVGDVNDFLANITPQIRRPQTDNDVRAARLSSPNRHDTRISEADLYQQIIQPLSEFRRSFDRIIGNIGDIATRGNMSMADLFQIQFQLTQLAYMNDLSAKTADKLSQGVQTLFRNQG